MSDEVLISLIICATILVAIWMLRSTITLLVTAKHESFTFAAKFLGSGVWIFRGTHQPTTDSLPSGKGTSINPLVDDSRSRP